MIVNLSAEAERDLERIGDRIATDNPARAVSFIQELRTKCLDLASFPERFPLVSVTSCTPFADVSTGTI